MSPDADSGSSNNIPLDDEYIYDDENDDKTNTSGRTLATTSTMYRRENGRTYHAHRDGEYWQPNDEQSNNHEAIIHHMCLMTLEDRLFLAPIEKPKRVLDIGTGTGIWATDVADKFPDAQVIGTDLTPVAPGMQPENVTFEVDDCCSHWVCPPDHFSFIHIRGLFGSIADWPTLYKEIYDHLEPGGYFEQLEWSVHARYSDGKLMGPDTVIGSWGANAIATANITGKTFEIAENMAGLIRESGFTNVVEKRFKWPIGPWSADPQLKELGRWNLLNWEAGMEGWLMANYTRDLGWSYAAVQEWLAKTRKELRERKTLRYHEVRVVYARKPL